MNVSDDGIRLIAEFEGFSAYLYDDPVGHATVGYGFLVHLGNYHRPRGVCAACDRWARKSESALWMTPAQGRELLREKVKSYADAVQRTSRPLNQREFDALTSLCFNIGPGGYLNSSVRRAVNTGGDVCGELRKYVRGTNGVTYPGLVRRRQAECVMFFDATPAPYPTPQPPPPPPVQEVNDDMMHLWHIEAKAVHLAGDFGAKWITDPNVAADLVVALGPPKPVHWYTIETIKEIVKPAP